MSYSTDGTFQENANYFYPSNYEYTGAQSTGYDIGEADQFPQDP